ncbi:MAG: aspartate aminotransferase family protein [Actinomycetota bacterium]|nr:aspartate aminotransferase family protein [Actinomycetota bacterium]
MNNVMPEPTAGTVFTRNTIPMDLWITKGQGTVIVDSQGRRMLDFCSQTLNLSLGHCHPMVNSVMSQTMRCYTFLSSRFANPHTVDLAYRLAELAPFANARVNVKLASGSGANECALKAAYKRRGSTLVVSMRGSHHGQTMETMRISGKHFDASYLDRTNVRYLQPCDCGSLGEVTCHCADALAVLLSDLGEQVAAMILEPVMVDAGVLVPSRGFLQQVRALTQQYGIPLIFDEIQTGMGWCGELFMSNAYQVSPDAITLGKGLAAGLPLAATLLRSDMDVLDYGEHEFTPGGNPLFCAVALANLGLLLEGGLLACVSQKGARLRANLEDLQKEFPHAVAKVRGLGLIYGIQLVGDTEEKLALRVFHECINRGLLLRISKVGERSDVLQIKPPLTVEDDEIDTAVSILRDVIKEIVS